MIFVNSMGDLFHKNVDFAYIDKVFEVMETADWHIYQVLTKRSSIMRDYLRKRYGKKQVPLHIWPGVSIENADNKGRIKYLVQINSQTRFISFESLLGPIGSINLKGIAWSIVGGESGPKARIIRPEWAMEIKAACEKFGVAFFFKQWGGIRPKSGGRLLEGMEWISMATH
jgi:protein gp37